MSKTAIIYYSVSGQTRFVVNGLKRAIDCDVFEIETEETIKPDFFSRYIKGIKQMRSSVLPKLKEMTFNADDYDSIVIASPTWASSCAPAVEAFAEENKIEGKKISFFTTYVGGGDKGCIEAMKNLFPNNTFVASASFKGPKKADREKLKEKIMEFGAQIKGE